MAEVILTTDTGAPRKPASMAIIAGVVILVGIGIWYGVTRILSVTGSVLVKHELVLDITTDDSNGPVISPDGDTIVYTKDGRLWSHYLSNDSAQLIEGSDGAERPFWSPDGRNVGFFKQATVGAPAVYSVPTDGGVIRRIGGLPAGYPYGADWKDDGEITVGLTPRTRGFVNAELYSLSLGEGSARILLQPMAARGESGIMYPSYLPDGSLMYALTTIEGAGTLVVKSGQTLTILISHEGEAIAFPSYSPSGHIVYQLGFPRSSGIWALPFNGVTKNRNAAPFRITDKGSMPSVSDNGTLVYHIPPGGELRQLVRVDRQGAVLDTVSEVQEEMDFPAIAPDDTRVAVTAKSDRNIDIWVHRLDNGRKLRLTESQALDHFPSWAPSGDHVAFSSTRNTEGGIFYRRSDAQGLVRPLVVSETAWAPSWGRDNALIYQSFSPDTQGDLAYIRPWTNRTSRPFLTFPSFEATPVISPDSRYVAYASDISGRSEIYITSFPRAGRLTQVSREGGALPKWSRSNHELFFVAPSQGGEDPRSMIMAVTVKTDGKLAVAYPQALFELSRIGSATAVGSYDVMGDGQHFLVVQAIDNTPKATVRIAENWHREFGR